MKRVALFVGIDRYKNGITELKCAVNDAKGLSLAFSKAQFDTVDSLLNEDAHCETVLGRVEELVADLKQGDLFVFYFSGHGRQIEQTHYLVGPTARAAAQFVHRGSVSIPELIAISDKPGINRLFILDCCRSNVLANRAGDYSGDEDAARDISLSNALKRIPESAEILTPLILNSCEPSKQAYEDNASGHGYFTRTLLNSIQCPDICNFQQFKESLKISGTPTPQKVTWSEMSDDWDNIKLFKHWENHSTAPAGTIISSIPVQKHSNYDVILKKLDIENLKNQLSGSVPDMVQKLLNLAEQAEKDKQYDSAMKILERVQNSLEDELKNGPEKLYTTGKKYYDAGNYDQAVKYFRAAAERNHAGAQFNLGDCYYDGHGVSQSHEEAIKWYRKAAEQNYARAQNNLGICYYEGHGFPQSYEEAIKWYRKAAEQNYAATQYNLGNCYYDGHGVSQSYEEAVKWYRKAAEQNYAEAQNNLGNCYYDGHGVSQSYEEAVKWYRKAAEQNDAAAQYNLGNCYYNGKGVSQSYEEAVKWYRKAAEQEEAPAQNSLGDCYANGYGVPESREEAVKWYRKAAEHNNAAAQNSLGFCYFKGYGVTQSYEEAVKWLQIAADQNYASAQNTLAVCYYNGYGVSQSYEKAVKWFRKSAEQNNDSAQNNLGACYYYGKGIPQSYEEAVKWYRKSAEQNNDAAQNNLGVCYEHGFSVPQSYEEAIKLYRKAAKNGNEEAKKSLDRLSQTNTSSSAADTQTVSIQRKTNPTVTQEEQDYSSLCRGVTYWKNGDYKSAFDIFLSIAHHNNACAQYNVALCFYYGNGTPKDKAKAVYWLKRASENGSKEAKEFLGQI
ncbi:MAG: SEL1-like repeat protein [Lentisphaeria bacterium]|nr:SEL1-like repeat protein [Lentisphaeria bacterium]